MSHRICICWLGWVFSACQNPEALLDCLSNPEVVCAPGTSCNYNTNRCQFECDVDIISGPISATMNPRKCPENENTTCVGGWCVDHVKEKCSKNSDCSSKLCKIYHDIEDSRFKSISGICVPEHSRTGFQSQNILYVDRDRCVVGGLGTQSSPYCEITTAVMRNTAYQRSYPIRVMPSFNSYSGNVFPPDAFSPVWIVGPDQDEQNSRHSSGLASEVVLESPVVLDGDLRRNADPPLEAILDGVHIRNDVERKDGISCTATYKRQTFRLRRSMIGPLGVVSNRQTMAAIYINGCQVEIDRSAIVNNYGNAIEMDLKSTLPIDYTVTNSIIAANGLRPTGVRGVNPVVSQAAAALAGTGVFKFNTVIGNGSQAATDLKAGVFCREAANTIEDSIIAANRVMDSSQIEKCSQVRISKDSPVFTGYNINPVGAVIKPEDFQLSSNDRDRDKKFKTAELDDKESYHRRLDYVGSMRKTKNVDKTYAGAFVVE